MLFNSFKFLFFFLPIVVFISSRLRGQMLLAWITLSSFVFYAFAGHVWFLIPMLTTTCLDFFLAQRIAAARSRRTKKFLLVFSLCGNLGLLFYFKYSAFLAGSVSYLANGILGMESHWGDFFITILPAGISFYTFQTLAYIIDVYQGEAEPEKNFFRFAAFVSFFPHLVAGPLTRHNQLIPGLSGIEKTGITIQWESGIFLFVIGLAKKVLIADRVANLIDPIIVGIDQSGFFLSWLAIIGYAIQIYFDFSGYSDMAIGLGRLFGIELPRNFNNPYQALNPSDFWQRWHITLSRWLRDYLYIPLGGNRGGKMIKYRNLMITMALGGLWHGASWSFGAWGVYHGALLVIYHEIKPAWDKFPSSVQRVLMFVCICLGWVFFRAPTFGVAAQWFAGLSGAHGLWGATFGVDWVTLALLNALALIIAQLRFTACSYEKFRELLWGHHVALGATAVVALIFMNYSSRFLYFQF